ncbi:Fas apoptotic inhibitory molecule 1 [Gryllus bimaculatus]|nr:Fas apoptotic inhibitory molecule 1 [Gryllus bimaculatus]
MAAAATAAAAAVAAGLCLGQTATARLNQQRAALGGGGGGGGSVSARAVAATTALTAGLVADARPPRGGAAGGAAGVMAGGDQVAVWEVPLQDGLHRIEFEHGTTSGKRVLRVDGSEILRRDWMFKLVGDEEFAVGGARCVLRVEPIIKGYESLSISPEIQHW